VRSPSGLEIPRTLAEICNPSRLALLIYDMQVGIARQIKDGDKIIASVGQLLAAARAASIRTCFTRHMSLPVPLMGAFQLRMAMAWQGVTDAREVKSVFLRDSPGFPIIPALAPQPSEAIFDKITMSAFEGTPLHIALRDCGITAFAIAGIALEVGIEPTIRHASDLGLIPVLIADACGSGNTEAARRTLETLAFEGNTLMTDVATFTSLITQPGDGRG
jgi:nicotinamidase-related amidase